MNKMLKQARYGAIGLRHVGSIQPLKIKLIRMKSIIKILSIGIALFTVTNTVTAQGTKNIQTEIFEVNGVCGMCEKRIEDAAMIKGVKMAEWNKHTQKLKVIYKPEKVNLIDIHKAIAKAGHDTEKVKATDEAYNKLPKCCAYRDSANIH